MKKRYSANALVARSTSDIMYVDMNSFFAGCEQQRNPELRGKPVGVVTYDSPTACVIAPSIEAKKMGVKTGMRLNDCRLLCPEIIPVTTHPAWYRQVHVDVMTILSSYCDDVLPKSIDEAVLNFASYRWVYKDLTEVANKIKADIAAKHDYLTCSIGIAPNSFYAKLATDLQKPNGLIMLTPENVDGYLAKINLTDFAGIASRNERRLNMIGIKTPLQMKYASPALLRKAFGGVVGDYWHNRLNFKEVDLYNNHTIGTMSATRTVSRQQRESPETLEAMIIALCTRLEQRMVKAGLFCKTMTCYVRYFDSLSWETVVKVPNPVQDGMEIKKYIKEKMTTFEQERKMATLLTNKVQSIGVTVLDFVSDKVLQYSLFDNRIRHDLLRKTMYSIKDKFGKNIVRKGAEMFDPKVMKDAVGFGSIRDMSLTGTDIVNKYLLEEDDF